MWYNLTVTCYAIVCIFFSRHNSRLSSVWKNSTLTTTGGSVSRYVATNNNHNSWLQLVGQVQLINMCQSVCQSVSLARWRVQILKCLFLLLSKFELLKSGSDTAIFIQHFSDRHCSFHSLTYFNIVALFFIVGCFSTILQEFSVSTLSKSTFSS